MNADWFYSAGEERRGPVTEAELRRLADEGQLKPTDLVWRDGMADWVEARSQKAVFPPVEERRRPSDVLARPDDPIDDDERPSRRGRRAEAADDGYDAEERPSRRGRRSSYDDEMDDDRPAARRRENRYEDDYEERPSRRSSRSRVKPGPVQTSGILMLIGGIWGIIFALAWFGGLIGFCWPPTYFELVWGILALIRGINMMNQDDQGPPKTLAILQILTILNGDIINCVLGIVVLVMLGDPQARDYYHKKGFDA